MADLQWRVQVHVLLGEVVLLVLGNRGELLVVLGAAVVMSAQVEFVDSVAHEVQHGVDLDLVALFERFHRL